MVVTTIAGMALCVERVLLCDYQTGRCHNTSPASFSEEAMWMCWSGQVWGELVVCYVGSAAIRQTAVKGGRS